MRLALIVFLAIGLAAVWAAAIAYVLADRRDLSSRAEEVTSPAWDDQRFVVTITRVTGPFYKVRIRDRVENCDVPLWRRGGMLGGRSSAFRAARFGIARYLAKEARPSGGD